jgi:hypothetical protein
MLYTPVLSHRNTELKRIYGPEYLCENFRDHFRRYNTQVIIKSREDFSENDRKIHDGLQTHLCPFPYPAGCSKTEMK